MVLFSPVVILQFALDASVSLPAGSLQKTMVTDFFGTAIDPVWYSAGVKPVSAMT
jgi:hypothetical protein